jgi:hypothetical protein
MTKGWLKYRKLGVWVNHLGEYKGKHGALAHFIFKNNMLIFGNENRLLQLLTMSELTVIPSL